MPAHRLMLMHTHTVMVLLILPAKFWLKCILSIVL